jgi:predicted ATPase
LRRSNGNNAAVQRKIVITGAPGAGKSVITAEIVRRDMRLVLVPEAATEIYTRLGTTWDRLNLLNRREAQRMIYRLQSEQEARIAAENPTKHLLLDRGTIDGAAYWPDGADAYWRDLKSSVDAELKRYDLIIMLETAAALGIYDGAGSNKVRFEDAAGAIDAGRKLLHLYQKHPRVRHVAAFANLEDKIRATMQNVDDALK